MNLGIHDWSKLNEFSQHWILRAQNKVKFLFLSVPFHIRKNIAFFKIRSFLPLVLLMSVTLRWKWLWSVSGILWSREDRCTHKKPAPLPHCPPHISYIHWPKLELGLLRWNGSGEPPKSLCDHLTLKLISILLRVLKCGAGEGCRGSVGSILLKM